MLDAEVTNHIFTTSLRCLPLIRYAEVLLNFAEARNEYSGPDQDVYDAIEAIRKRAGLDPYTLPPGLNQEEMREIIGHERRVERAFEAIRFWVVRSWMIAHVTDTNSVYGMRIIRTANEGYSYKHFTVRNSTL